MLPENISADEVLGTPRAVTRCIAEIPAETLAWLWPGRIPLGKLTILSGDPGLGKSLVTLAITTAVSRGAPWPCGEGIAQVADAVLVSAEDDPADTIRPRLEAAGADLSRIHVLDAVEYTDENGVLHRRPWNFTDIEALDARLVELSEESRLLIVDPLSAYLAGIDSHKNSDVRALLAPLAEMAARRRVAVLCVSHLNKSSGPAMYRTSGSLAFVAAARAVYAVAKDQDDPSRRLVLPVKCNLAKDSTGLAYRIGSPSGVPVVEWEPEPVTISAEEALTIQADGDERGEMQGAAEWLRELLAEGPMTRQAVQDECREAGFSWRTVQRAMHSAGVESHRGGFGEPAAWALRSRANGSPSKILGATGSFGATVENTGLAGGPVAPFSPVAPTPRDGATGATEVEAVL